LKSKPLETFIKNKMVETILASGFFRELVLPFLLVFTLIFAILDKTKILGEGKRQINAIIAFVVGLIFISFSYAVGITVKLMGFMAIVAVILLVFMLLYAFAAGEKEEFKMPRGLKIAFGILIGLALIIALLVFTGSFGPIYAAILGGYGNEIVVNIIFIIIIIAAIAVVLGGKGKSESKE